MKSDELSQTQSFIPDADDDPRLLQLSREYLAELELGNRPDKAAYLERMPVLKAELQRCLEGLELAHGLSRSTPSPNAEIDFQPLGDFRIVRQIGRGGMGVVYEAIQLSLGRSVALKVLPFAASLDDRHLQRFRVEAQAAAQLHHTNIVPVYAVGCDRGTHYYAMQLINGQSVAEAIENADRSAKTIAEKDPTNKISPIQESSKKSATIESKLDSTLASHAEFRLGASSKARFRSIAKLIADVADALDYAHACGVVHRDIKPANLLLDRTGKIWITDFGLAHVATNQQVTQTGDLLGTLRYMSPEQASGQRGAVDHRTDIYSLGVTLYELLTGKSLFDGQDRQRLLNQILNESPTPPRQLNRSIPLELDTIVLKAIESSAADRYASAGAMAQDLKRFLDQRPILAKRATLVDQTRKWMRRHPATVASVVLVSIIGFIAAGITAAAVARQRGLVEQSLAREMSRAQQAENRLALAQSAADEMIALAEDELSDNPFEEGLRQRLLSLALSYYQDIIKERGEDPDARNELEITRDRVSRILADLSLVQTDRYSILLTEPDVLKDLNLSADAQVQIEAFISQHELNRRLQRRPMNGPPPRPPFTFGPEQPEQEDRPPPPDGPPMYETIVEAAKLNDARLSQILTTKQRERLKQISLQIQGPMVFRELDVVTKLSLTADQKSEINNKIESAFHESRFRMRFERGGPDRGGPDRGGPNRGGPERGGPGKGNRFDGPLQAFADRMPPGGPHGFEPNLTLSDIESKDLVSSILALLTPDQREIWSKMIGMPFDGKLTFQQREGLRPF